MNWNKVIPDFVWGWGGAPLISLENDELVSKYARLQEMQAELEARQAEIKNRLDQELSSVRQLNFEINQLSRINEVFEGVALNAKISTNAHGRTAEVSAVVYSITRRARIWPNCQRPGRFGLGIVQNNDWMEYCVHFNFEDFDDLFLRAKRFVAHGTTP